jgi:GNAT superfamily N-acetyltransferase
LVVEEIVFVVEMIRAKIFAVLQLLVLEATPFHTSSQTNLSQPIQTQNDANKDSRPHVFLEGQSTSDETSARQSDSLKSKIEANSALSFAAPAVEFMIADNNMFLNAVGSFLVDSFWLSSDHHLLGNTEGIQSDARMNLIVKQCADLQEKYGERLGRRLSKSCVMGALDKQTKEMIGVATLKETLLIMNDIVEPEKAEIIAQSAVARMSPKQRREYRNADVSVIATELLSPDTKAVCVLSNLAVSRKARRRGIGTVLCEEIEALARDWGYKSVYLLVEHENKAARQLYEDKLGYSKVCMKQALPVLRVDVETGLFLEIQSDTLIMSKKL